MIKWSLYQINSNSSNLIGVKFRGSLRKFAISNSIDLIAENASDEKNCVRFAVFDGISIKDLESLKKFISEFVTDTSVKLIKQGVQNPIMSKLKVNDEDRYKI
jgi:hypothetical protein